ncbi:MULTISPECIES: hypothetical protein [Streptomycetaceae]|uniref:hypothetical protein n=1 Tax=Streptomycetaceae TaxID=2062 RepID=UPI0004BD23D4|nr:MULTISPECIES: hypothetical protein [Streptomycetaceae]
MPDEDNVTVEVQQVRDALSQVKAIADPVERAAAISEVLADFKKASPGLRDDRRETVLGMLADGVSYRKIAARIRTSVGTVQSIERGHAGAWGTKSRRKSDATKPDTE